MPNAVISDASCIIILDKIDELSILKSLYSNILITEEIANECPKKDVPDIDMLKRKITGGQPICLTHIYLNNKIQECFYIVEINRTTLTQEGSSFIEHITIPSIDENYIIKVETIVSQPEYG